MNRYLVKGDPMNPAADDLIVEVWTVQVGEPVHFMNGTRVLGGNNLVFEVGRLVYRYEIKEEHDNEN